MLRHLAALAASLLLTVVAAANPPRAEVDRTEVDFGRITGVGPAHQDVRIRNSGDAPLRIERVGLTPPLRLAGMRAQVGPGDTATLRLSLNPEGLSGRFTGRVVAHTNDPGAPEVVLSVVGEVARPIALSPEGEFFLAGVRGERAERSIEIVNNEAAPLELQAPRHSTARFSSDLQVVERGRRFRLSVALRPDGPSGKHFEDITLATSNASVPVLTIPVHTLLRERVHTFPDAVDLGALPLSAIGADPDLLRRNAQTLMIYQKGGTDFRIAAATDVPGLSIKAERAKAGDRHQVTIQFDPSRATAARRIAGHILIETNDPDFRTLRVPVTGGLLAL